MRLSEFVDLKETATAGATGSGSVATVSMPLGGMISRNGDSFFSGTKYTTDNATPNTPAEYKRYKRKKK
jgi:hypothetical protein